MRAPRRELLRDREAVPAAGALARIQRREFLQGMKVARRELSRAVTLRLERAAKQRVIL